MVQSGVEEGIACALSLVLGLEEVIVSLEIPSCLILRVIASCIEGTEAVDGSVVGDCGHLSLR